MINLKNLTKVPGHQFIGYKVDTEQSDQLHKLFISLSHAHFVHLLIFDVFKGFLSLKVMSFCKS